MTAPQGQEECTPTTDVVRPATPLSDLIATARRWHDPEANPDGAAVLVEDLDRALAAHDAEVVARALREAAEYLFEDEDAGLNVVLGGPGYVHYWLRERADRIERQEGDR